MHTPRPARRPIGSRRHVLGVLLSLMLIYVALSAGVCPETFQTSTTETRLQTGEKPDFQASLKADAPSAAPGQQVSRTLGATGYFPPGSMTLIWTPPPGAYGFTFDHPPDNSTPPFVWADFGVGVTNTARFRTPSLPPKSMYVESLQRCGIRWGQRARRFSGPRA